MTSIREAVKRFFQPAAPLPAGVYHYQAPPGEAAAEGAASLPNRLHLRLEADGSGILILNAATVLHLNRTAAEYAYHLIQQTPAEQVAAQVSKRYRVLPEQARQDYEDISARILELVNTPDLDPETFLDFSRQAPHTFQGAPYRLDCALTYRLPQGESPELAPQQAVTRELTREEWCAVLDKAWGAGFIHVVFTGGEPTLRDDLPDLIARAEANGQVTGLLTDGLRLADAAYLETLLQTGLDHLLLLCQPGVPDFWQALKNASAADIYITVHLTLGPATHENAAELLQLIAAQGAHAVSLTAQDSEWAAGLDALRSQAAALGLALVWDLPVPYSELNPVALETATEAALSGAGKAWVYLEPDGDLKPAQADPRLLGNFLREPWEALQARLRAV
jgi:hypothetical protein